VLGYCYHRGTSSQPDMSEKPWSQLRALHKSFLKEAPYKAELVSILQYRLSMHLQTVPYQEWIDTSDRERSCSIWSIVLSERVLPSNLMVVVSGKELPENLSLVKEELIEFPRWIGPDSYERRFETYNSSSDRDALRVDSGKEGDRNLAYVCFLPDCLTCHY
jgi:hypothetical protein